MCGSHALLHAPAGLVPSLEKGWLAGNDVMEEKGSDCVCAHPLLSGCSAWPCPGSLLGAALSMACLPHFLGKEGDIS